MSIPFNNKRVMLTLTEDELRALRMAAAERGVTNSRMVVEALKQIGAYKNDTARNIQP